MPAKKPRSVTFVSKHESLRVVRKCAEDRILPNGTVTIASPEKAYEFHHGVLVLQPGQDMMLDYLSTGEEVKQDAIGYFRSEPRLAQWCQEAKPAAPDVKPELKKIAKLAARGDTDALVAMGDEEAEEWARDEVLDAINDALDAINEAQAAKAQPAKAQAAK